MVNTPVMGGGGGREGERRDRREGRERREGEREVYWYRQTGQKQLP